MKTEGLAQKYVWPSHGQQKKYPFKKRYKSVFIEQGPCVLAPGYCHLRRRHLLRLLRLLQLLQHQGQQGLLSQHSYLRLPLPLLLHLLLLLHQSAQNTQHTPFWLFHQFPYLFLWLHTFFPSPHPAEPAQRLQEG
jgi:hypothetical protein